MKTWSKAVLCISLSVMCLFSCIGYAAISDNLMVEGVLSLTPTKPQGIYISEVEAISFSGMDEPTQSVVLPTNLNSSFSVDNVNASVTYKITVRNETDMTYWYLGPKTVEASGNNNLINVTNGIVITTKDGSASNSTLFDTSDWVPPRTDRVFYATYVFGSRVQGDVSTLINFSFGFNMVSVSDGFLKVLNDKVSEYGYYYLADAFNKIYSRNGGTVIGNIGNDEDIFNNLFGSSLTLNMNGEDLPVTILVERKNVDGKSTTGDKYSGNNAPAGCEYTVYISVDNLENNGGKATVYAVSYTCGSDGTWYMIGELYEGTCTIEDYKNASTDDNDSFNVSSWRATQNEYTVINNVTYKVGYTQQGTEYDRYVTINQLMSNFDQEFYNKVNNNSASFLQSICKTLYSYTHSNGKYIESENAANIAKPGYDDLKRAFDRLKPYCLIANGAQEVKLTDSARNLSRAELIQMLEAIQTTYNYYLSVNSYN